MRWRWRAVLGAPIAFVLVIAACSGDDEVFRAEPAYAYDASTFDRAPIAPVVAEAAAPGLFCGDAAGAPQRILAVNGGELIALNLDTQAVDGRLSPNDGGDSLVSSALNIDPWVVDQAQLTVSRLDPRSPWIPVATWNLGDDAGARPLTVVQVSCTKAYVLDASRQRIAIIDPSQSGGGPMTWLEVADFADLTSAVWVPEKRKVFVLAGNVDHGAQLPGVGLECTDAQPAIFAIDIATDTVVSLTGKGAGGAILLTGYDPAALVYDAPFDRLIVLSRGCNVPPGDGNAGQVKRRRIEQVDLATAAVKTLLPLEMYPSPTVFALADGDHAFVTIGRDGYFWNPHQTTLGPAIDGGLDLVANDGRGGLVGASHRGNDLSIVTLPLDPDAAAIPITRNPFSGDGGSVTSLEAWPHR
jgi:hypothetical protein